MTDTDQTPAEPCCFRCGDTEANGTVLSVHDFQGRLICTDCWNREIAKINRSHVERN